VSITTNRLLFTTSFFVMVMMLGCSTAENSEEISSRLLADRQAKEERFLDHERSPLTQAQKEAFDGLEFYPVDLDYRIRTTIHEYPAKDTIEMAMSAQGTQKYIRWGEFEFSVHDHTVNLRVYKPLQYSDEYHPYFFIPFRDQTNGAATFEGGRYLDIPIHESNRYVIDFNRAYNPYCAYNPNGWTCPLPPDENTLDFPLRAGEKAFTLAENAE